MKRRIAAAAFAVVSIGGVLAAASPASGERVHPPKPFQPVDPVGKGGTAPPGEFNANGGPHRPT